MSRIKKFFQRLKKAFLKQPILYAILILLIVIGGWLRLYRIDSTIMFQGDQGRDAIIVAKIFKDFDLAFVGPVTSIGNMYLGPFYYYFMLPFLFISYPSPVGPAVGVALANIAAIAIFYFLGSKMVGKKAALWASFFFTFSNVGIFYSRFSWNPNLSALCAFLTLYFLYQALNNKTKNWLWVGLTAGILIQLHYVNLIVIAICGLFWFYQWWQKRRDRFWQKNNHFWQYSFGAIAIFVLTMVPLIFFDWKYDWRNIAAAGAIFGKEESFSNKQSAGLLSEINLYRYHFRDRAQQIIVNLTLPEFSQIPHIYLLAYVILITFLIISYRRKNDEHGLGYQIFGVSLLVSITITAFYRHNVYDHYLLSALPISCFVLGCLVSWLPKKNWTFLVNLAIGVIFLSGNYQSNFYKQDYMLNQIDQLTDFLLKNVNEEEEFGVSLINSNGDSFGEHYRYFLETKTDKLVPISRTPNVNTLLIIDETQEANLEDSANFDIVVFRNAQASVSALPYDGHKIYKMEKLVEEVDYDKR
ncbi:MAG: glycosyltransferase family 39 protein [bacterium]|nr:glycosyltransferase family 39 protein [bacterium]